MISVDDTCYITSLRGLKKASPACRCIPAVTLLNAAADHAVHVNCWFTRNLGDAMLAGEALEQIKALFLAEYENGNSSKERALFVRHESEGRLHCEVKVYFSPATSIIAKEVNAIPCNKPHSNGLDLLAGSEESGSVFFTEKDGKCQ